MKPVLPFKISAAVSRVSIRRCLGDVADCGANIVHFFPACRRVLALNVVALSAAVDAPLKRTEWPSCAQVKDVKSEEKCTTTSSESRPNWLLSAAVGCRRPVCTSQGAGQSYVTCTR